MSTVPHHCQAAAKKPRGRAIGTESFAKLVLQSDVFVDKTLLIQEFLERGDEVALITRPRRWGKSLNMDMLKCFLAIEVDEQGKALPPAQCLHRKVFAGGKVTLGPDADQVKQLAPLKIAQEYPDLVHHHQGKYPVIRLGLKDVRGRSYLQIENAVKEKITELYREDRYLAPYRAQAAAGSLKGEYKKLQRYFDETLTREDIVNSLRLLSWVLNKDFGQPVYILIDEYDTPINQAYLKLQDKAEFEKVLELFRELLGATLKGNSYLAQSLITGIFRIARADLFSSLNNVREYTLLDPGFITSYGFTQPEVDELLTQVNMSTISEEIRRWYNGYTFGKHVFYNPWSIMCCLGNEGALDHYWLDSGGTQLIDSVLLSDAIQPDLQTLIDGGTLSTSIMKQISFDDITELEGLYSLLLFSGYLKPKSPQEKPSTTTYELSIPNYEVQHIYEQRLMRWISQKLEISLTAYKSLMGLLASGQVMAFAKNLQELLHTSTSFHQTGPKQAEVFYGGFMLGLASTLSGHYNLESERESGLGRADAMLIPQVGHGDQALIIEYKVGKSVAELAGLAERGLAQIVHKKYSTQVKSQRHVRKILQVCLSFCGKEVAIKYAHVDLRE